MLNLKKGFNNLERITYYFGHIDDSHKCMQKKEAYLPVLVAETSFKAKIESITVHGNAKNIPRLKMRARSIRMRRLSAGTL